MTIPAGISSFAGAVLRIVSGAMFSFHGAQKLFGVLSTPEHQPPAWSQLWFGGIIELIGGILIALGLFTRPAALLASGTMAVAYFQFHWKLAMDHWKFLPAVNGGELAVLYCFVFLVFAVSGAGSFSIDRLRSRA
ncbi:MAG TPA: DoxX family protein [Kofleriaceae bacterium]|jgi:putative oxidoreductase|nr:DoxX family protein [Kofleriaceae bacterium]